jgi:hypothetical protein
MNQRSISWGELDDLQMFAADKFGYITEHEKWLEAISDFVQTYINGGKFVVYNSRNQFLADFDVLDDAIYYKEENEPKNELFCIECEILN